MLQNLIDVYEIERIARQVIWLDNPDTFRRCVVRSLPGKVCAEVLAPKFQSDPRPQSDAHAEVERAQVAQPLRKMRGNSHEFVCIAAQPRLG
jgi:hypothetical protein